MWAPWEAAPSGPSPLLFQSVWPSLSDKALWPMTTGAVWGSPGTEHKCWGKRGNGGLTWPADPWHSAGCQHRAACPSHACAPWPSPQARTADCRAEPSWPALQTWVQSKVQVTLGALVLATRAWEGLAPVGLAGKVMFLLARSPEVSNFLWHLLCGGDNMQEQSRKQRVGRMHRGLLALRRLDHHPQHQSCPQKKQPKTVLSAEVSMGQGVRGDAGGPAP